MPSPATVFVGGPFKGLIDPDTGVLAPHHRRRYEMLLELFDEYGWQVRNAHRTEGWGMSTVADRICTERDFDWMRTCDLFVAFPGQPASPGTHVEIGLGHRAGQADGAAAGTRCGLRRPGDRPGRNCTDRLRRLHRPPNKTCIATKPRDRRRGVPHRLGLEATAKQGALIVGRPIRALTVGFSDSSGGAGIQCDIKAFTAVGAFASTVLVGVTAQNTRGVYMRHGIPLNLVAAQWDALLDDVGTDTIRSAPYGALS